MYLFVHLNHHLFSIGILLLLQKLVLIYLKFLALWAMAWRPLSNLVDIIFRREHFVRKRYATSPIQLIVNVISGTFEFFMLVGWEPSLTNLHASLINDPHHHHINHQTVYIVATGCLKTLKRVHAWNTKTLAAFTSSPKTNIVFSFLETGKNKY